jgi:hypothetical protein
MPREARFDILFEPVEIGPVTAKNRFFQVPHCDGMGHARPRAHAAMRGVKAVGGWGVVSTEHGRGGDPRLERHIALHRRPALGRCGHPGPRNDDGAAVVAVTSRVPNDALAAELGDEPERLAQAGIASVVSVGDCWAPGTIAAAVYAGHRHAREFDRPPGDDIGFARELPEV